MNQLPMDGRSQEIGRLAGRALGNKLPKAWVDKEQDGDSDYGIDYLIQLKSKENLVSFSLYLQLKGTTSPSYNTDKSFISYDFKVSTLNYYHQQEPLVMVAIVDLLNNEDTLWECPVYYVWLDEEWFESNKQKLDSNKTISVKIPTSQLIVPSLDIYEFYANRIQTKLELNQLKSTVESHSTDVETSLRLISERIAEKPVLLKSIEEKNDAPWVHNPDGTIANELKKCSDGLSSNKLSLAKKIISKLGHRSDEFSDNEKAEFYFQQGNILTLEGQYDLAEEKYQTAFSFDDKDRYRLASIESRFKLDSLPTDEELSEIADKLNTDNFHECIIKAKCLALTGKADEALEIMRAQYPDKFIGQMIVMSLSGLNEELEHLISENKDTLFESERDAYIFYSISARRLFFGASKSVNHLEEMLPIQGKQEYVLGRMKEALFYVSKAWNAAKNLGYPGDVGLILDISPLVYGYFNKVEELFKHFDAVLSERPNHPTLIQTYSSLLFNVGEFEQVIKLVERLDTLDAEGCGLLIMSNYNLKNSTKVLELVEQHLHMLLDSSSKNIPMIFCVASQLASAQLDIKTATQYDEYLSRYNDGEALLAIREFVTQSNQHPDKRQEQEEVLYERYQALEGSPTIAEQLFGYLDAHEKKSALKVIELGLRLLQTKELTPDDYLHLAQAFLTSEQWTKAEEIASKNIAKGIDVSNWKIIKSAALHHQGKIGAAFDTVKEEIKTESVTNKGASHYVNLCLKLGLNDEAAKILKELISNTSDNGKKISLLKTLIGIYSSSQEYEEQLKHAVDRYGALVDQDNCIDEGHYLLSFMFSPKHDDDEEKIKEFQKRLAQYTEKFPDSPVLKQFSVNSDAAAEDIIQQINQVSGLTDNQIQQWEKNKNLLRQDRLPIPFCYLDRFLSDTRDIYTSWALSLHTPNNLLEYKIKHSPQLDSDMFFDLISSEKTIVIEETSLLILNELKILDKFLGAISRFSLLNSVFDKLSNSTHPLSGSIHKRIPTEIIETIKIHINKLVLFTEDNEENHPAQNYSEALKQADTLLLTDDLYMFQYLTSENGQIISGNSFNIIEYLHQSLILSEAERHNLTANLCELGIFELNMRIDFLCESARHYLDVKDGVNYDETSFKSIFNKLFDSNRNKEDVIELFFIMLRQSKSVLQFSSKTLLSLFRGLLLRHQFKELKSFIALWFVFMSLYTKPKVDNPLIPSSKTNAELWSLYKEMILTAHSGELNNEQILKYVVEQLSDLNSDAIKVAHKHIKSCFIPLTEEAGLFESLYQNMTVMKKLGTL